MFRVIRRFFLTILLAALTAAGLVLWLSPDPLYESAEWFGGSRYWAFDPLIIEVANKRGVDPRLVKAIVWRESAFHPEQVGTSGERGLMQVGEAAGTDWALAHKRETFLPIELFDPRTNLEVGVWYFAKALEHWKAHDDPVAFALAEYNAGRGRVDRWVAATNMGDKATVDDLLAAIEITSTRKYIQDIIARWHFYQDRGRM